jgi:hypothetical protein
MNKIPSEVLQKIYRRVSGIETRQLHQKLANAQHELANAQHELANAQHELVNSHANRNNRLHLYVAEALGLVAPNRKIKANAKFEFKSQVSVFTEFGSDKDTRHSYGNVYLDLLSNFSDPKILEIGVGSVNSFPYAGLAAGGGLKAFRKCFPGSEITGLDIDPESIEIINSDGFNGFVVDQTSGESLSLVKNRLKHLGPFDLIIDDGFHDPHANVRTLQTLFELLSDKGTYVIEDVHESLINFWEAISVHLPGTLQVLDMREMRPGVDDNILLLITKG